MMGFSPGGGFPRLKPIVTLRFFRWTEVQLPLLKQGLPPNVPTDNTKLAGMAPREVGAARGLCTQRFRAGLTSVAPLALGAGGTSSDARVGQRVR